MHRILILLFALLMISGVEPAEAARPSAYARAKAHGRIYTHRPSYKAYKGRKSHKKKFFRKASAGKTRHTARRASRL